MALKFVYALVSSPNDYYADQAAMSMWSLKMHNPGAQIVLVTDGATLQTLTGERGRVLQYVDKRVEVAVPNGLTPTQRSRYLKTTLRSNISGDFLYIDNDTVITRSLADLEDVECEMGAVLDGHRRSREVNQLNDYARITGRRFWNYDKYFNGGLLFVRDTERTHRLFADWHRIWDADRIEFGLSLDQPAFAQANINNDYLVHELDGSYNCQIIIPDAVLIMPRAKILHYFDHAPAGTFFPLRNEKFLKLFREKGMNPVTEAILTNPRDFILDDCFVLKDKDLAIYNSPMVVLGRKLAADYPYSNKIAKWIYRMFGYRL